MKKWIKEDWAFEITVTKGKAEECRMGFETGDRFTCEYECPAGFCPKTMHQLYTLCEIIRCGGDFRLRGSNAPYEVDFSCADGPIQFHLTAKPVKGGSEQF